MSNENYLTYDEQFQKILNLEQISRIKNDEIRKIREKYWHKRHETFIDEANISDSELEEIWDRLCSEEQKELEPFKNK